jgi:hypothetical protein
MATAAIDPRTEVERIEKEITQLKTDVAALEVEVHEFKPASRSRLEAAQARLAEKQKVWSALWAKIRTSEKMERDAEPLREVNRLRAEVAGAITRLLGSTPDVEKLVAGFAALQRVQGNTAAVLAAQAAQRELAAKLTPFVDKVSRIGR